MKRNLKKICGHCGSEFTCGLYGCWCSDISISPAQYEQITERFHECLCPGCLEAISQGTLDVFKLPSPS